MQDPLLLQLATNDNGCAGSSGSFAGSMVMMFPKVEVDEEEVVVEIESAWTSESVGTFKIRGTTKKRWKNERRESSPFHTHALGLEGNGMERRKGGERGV